MLKSTVSLLFNSILGYPAVPPRNCRLLTTFHYLGQYQWHIELPITKLIFGEMFFSLPTCYQLKSILINGSSVTQLPVLVSPSL